MLNKMRAALSLNRAPPEAQPETDPIAAAHAFFSAQIAKMPLVEPPDALNKDPMGGVTEVVEHELRVAGYLR